MATVVGSPVPDGLEGIVGRCLAKDPKDRYPTANELLLDLQRVPKFEVAADPLPRRPIQRPETLHAHEVPSLAPTPPKKSSKFLWASLAAAGVLSLGAWFALENPSDGVASTASQREIVKSPPTPDPRAATKPVAEAPKKESEVHFVLSPIDARLYRGDEDLGPMPVSVKLKTGEPVTFLVRRRGYQTRKVVVDGTETRIVIGLVVQKDEAPARSQSPSRSSARRVNR
jgi:serine/threonine-protein kinase